jgi:hypothetical protein
MKVNWKQVAQIGAGVVGMFVPGAVEIERYAEQAVTAPDNAAKAAMALEAAIKVIETEGQLAGKQYATPRVQTVLRKLNDDSVELLNALAEAHAA